VLVSDLDTIIGNTTGG